MAPYEISDTDSNENFTMPEYNSGLSSSMWASGLTTHVNRNRNNNPYANVAPRQSSDWASVNLAASGVAPAEPAAPANNPSSQVSLAQSLQRLEQTHLRLRWKSIDLENSYQRTINAHEFGFDPDNAERNFKIDFYEYYSWIEQAVVLLQRIFGVEIVAGGGHNHAYHHNVLQALSDPTNPLKPILGTGEVYQALWKAKELRNRWKDAAIASDTPPLRMYDLSWIVGTIVQGLGAAYGPASEMVESQGAFNRDFAELRDQNWDWMMEEEMDWEI